MELNGKKKLKFFLNLNFYTFIILLVFAIYVFYLYQQSMLLRNKANIIASCVLFALILFSTFQSIVVKYKDNIIKFIICFIILTSVGIVGIVSNKVIINKYLVDEVVDTYEDKTYIVTNDEAGNKYYYEIYNDYVKSRFAKFSINESSFKDGNITIKTISITTYDKDGKKVKTDTKNVME